VIFNTRTRHSTTTFVIVLTAFLVSAGCKSREFNAGNDTNVKSNESGAQSEFEVCGKQYEVEKGSDVRVIRLNPRSATLLSAKRSDSKIPRYAPLDLSRIEEKLVKEKFRQCYLVRDEKGILQALSARAMNADEDYASFEMVVCGKLTEEKNGFKISQVASNSQKGDFWIIYRKKSFEAELQSIVKSQNSICVIGKPIKYETGIAVVFDDQSYVVAGESKRQ
jgi:hypothetical protein